MFQGFWLETNVIFDVKDVSATFLFIHLLIVNFLNV